MDFLTSLYSNENFGIILFTSVSILVLAFLIILFFGKKDQKERNIANEQTNNENMNEANIKSEVAFGTNDSITNVELPNNNKTNDFLNTQASDIITLKETEANEESTVMEEPSSEEELENVPVPPKSDFDFDALAASISKELESIGLSEDTFVAEPNHYDDIQNQIKNQNMETSKMEEEKENSNTNLNLYDPPKQTEPTIEMNLDPVNITETTDVNTMPNPTQFSSVYVNNKAEEENAVNTSNPPMDLPKKIELPKLNPEVMQKTEQETPNMMFPSLENEIPIYHDENRM